MKQSVHLIHIGDRDNRLRAIEAFLDVPEQWARFPGNVLGVTGKHIEALRNAVPPIEFETAKKSDINGKKSPLQPK